MRPLIGDQYSGKYPKIRQKTGVTMEKHNGMKLISLIETKGA